MTESDSTPSKAPESTENVAPEPTETAKQTEAPERWTLRAMLEKIHEILEPNWVAVKRKEGDTKPYPTARLLEEEAPAEGNTKDHRDAVYEILRTKIGELPPLSTEKKEAAPSAAPQPEAPKVKIDEALSRFTEVINENTDVGQALNNIAMLIWMLRTSYGTQASALPLMGFDSVHLTKEMQAAFILADDGKYIDSEDLDYKLGRPPRTLKQVMFYDMLSLNSDSDADEIKQKSIAFADVMKQKLRKLFIYPPRSRSRINAALQACENNAVPGKKNAKKVEEIMSALNFDGKAQFFDDEKILDAIIEEAKQKMEADAQAQAAPVVAPEPAAAVAPTPAPEAVPEKLDVDKYYRENENHTTLILLCRLHQAMKASVGMTDDYKIRFQDRYLNGDSAKMLASRLNDLFEIYGCTAFGDDLKIAGMDDRDLRPLLRKMVDELNIEDPKTLNEKLDEMYYVISLQYPKLLPIDYKSLWGDENQELVSACFPFHHLFYFFAKEKEYETDYRPNFFKGHSRDKVMANMEQVMGEGITRVLKEAALRPTIDPETDHLTFLLEAVANHYRLAGDPVGFKAKLLEIRAKLEPLYPAIL